MGVAVKRLLVPALYTALALTVLFSVRSVMRDFREIAQWGADTTRTFDSVEVHRLIHDTVEAVVTRNQQVVDSLQSIANRRSVLRNAAERKGDSLLARLDSAVSESDSLFIALQTAQSYRVALGEATGEIVSLRSIVAQQALSLSRLETDNKTAWADIDSLQSLIRRTPTCRKIPILGISAPKLGIGYFATTGGHGIGVGVFVPLGKC